MKTLVEIEVEEVFRHPSDNPPSMTVYGYYKVPPVPVREVAVSGGRIITTAHPPTDRCNVSWDLPNNKQVKIGTKLKVMYES